MGIEQLNIQILILLSILAFIAGFVDAIAGGGGLLTIPALMMTGLPIHVVLGTNKLAASFGSSTAAWAYYRKKLFFPQYWWRSFVATFISAIIGVQIVNLISTDSLKKVLPIVIFAVAIYTLVSKRPQFDGATLPDLNKTTARKQWIQGAILGCYDATIGPGTGSFWAVSNMILYKINLLIASGIAKAMNFTSNITSLVSFALLGYVNWQIGITMGLCIMVGAYVGAHSAIRFGSKFIRPIFIVMVLISAVKLAHDAWFV